MVKSSCGGSKSAYQDSIDDLLSEREGWGEDTIGGAGGNIFIVDTKDDSESGCSLRRALTDSSKYWIVFDSKLKGETIKLSKPILVKSYKTIDGRGSEVTIRAPPRKNQHKCATDTALKILQGQEIIINDMRFDGDVKDWDKDGECSDAIFLQEMKRVWVHRNEFYRWPDSAVEVRITDDQKTLNKKITITRNHIHEIFQAFVISAEQLTFGRNYCEKVRRRCVKVANGKAHSFNNVIEGWTDRSIEGVVNGQLYTQQNYFWANEGYKRIHKLEEKSGAIRCSGNYAKSAQWCKESGKCSSSYDCTQNGGKVSSSFASDSEKNAYSLKECSSSSCYEDLFDDVTSQAGPRK